MLKAILLLMLLSAAQCTLYASWFGSDSTIVTGCWISSQSKSEVSAADSFYNTNYYYVQLTMCLDEHNNIEINRKIKLDCCNEENQRFTGTYTLRNDTLRITTENPDFREMYKVAIDEESLSLLPLDNLSGNVNISERPVLKYKWLKY